MLLVYKTEKNIELLLSVEKNANYLDKRRRGS